LNFNETGLSSLLDENGFYTGKLGFDLSANLNDTVLSRDTEGGYNRDIYSLSQFGGDKFISSGDDIFLYEEKANLMEVGKGLELGTERIIGSDIGFTNLVRAGDTIKAKTEWLNSGNVSIDIKEIHDITGETGSNVSLDYYEINKTALQGAEYSGGGFDQSTSDSLVLTADLKVNEGYYDENNLWQSSAGSIVDLTKGVVRIEADGVTEQFTNTLGTKNLITYQGDLNYDGRVSMKDLAYLNAGAARVKNGGDVAKDVDADFNGTIDLADLAVLDKDWGESLHVGDETFLGSNELSWETLDKQGETNFHNDSFKEQNTFEAFNGFEGSLESATSNVIGADGNNDAQDDDMLGGYFQDT